MKVHHQPIIDTHQHFWKYDPVRYGWIDDSMHIIQRDFLPDDLKPALDENGVSSCIAVQTEQNESGTEFLLQLARAYAFIKGVIGWVDLSAVNAAERIRHFATDSKFKGVRHTAWDNHGEFLLEEDFLRGVSHLEQHHLVYEILVFDYQLAAAVEMVNHFPNQVFVLNHLGKPDFSAPPDASWKKHIYALASHEKVFCKLSGMFSVPGVEPTIAQIFEYFDILKNAFGEKRLLFGSDWPLCVISGSYNKSKSIIEKYFSLNASHPVSQVMAANAIKVYRL